jgi:hypothetical protein
MASGDTKTEAMLNVLGNGGSGDEFRGCCNTKTQTYILDAIDRVQKVEDDVEEMKNNPDVADIVATYADLQAYDTSKLTDKDVIRVLADETHSGDSTYYRFNKSDGTFTYIGESKQYTNFIGTDGTSAGANGLVPAPAVADAGKFLNANGSWETVQAGPTVVQNTGGSITNVMSQNATTGMVFADPATVSKVRIASGSISGTNSITIGKFSTGVGAYAVSIGSGSDGSSGPNSGDSSVSIGRSARFTGGAGGSVGKRGIAIGAYSKVATAGNGAIALGSYSYATEQGQMDISTLATTNTEGYNNSQYRLLTGLYDGQNAHDAVTLGQLNTRLDNLTLLKISQTDYDNLQNKDANTLYVITGA